jgi:carbon catabolite-derepressing protein kinase
MEVMLEIYRTLKTLGMEWKEKKNLGGLGGVRARRVVGGGIERAKEFDGDGSVDLKAAAGIYFVETRARVQDVVVLMNLQLYMVDSINYLVDFHHRKSYRASTDPAAGKFDMAVPDPNFAETMSESSSGRSVKEKDGSAVKEDEVVSPFVFMDVACRLILELAGGGE